MSVILSSLLASLTAFIKERSSGSISLALASKESSFFGLGIGNERVAERSVSFSFVDDVYLLEKTALKGSKVALSMITIKISSKQRL
jgi:hypothetical protein